MNNFGEKEGVTPLFIFIFIFILSLILVSGIIIKITLNMNDRRTLVA